MIEAFWTSAGSSASQSTFVIADRSIFHSSSLAAPTAMTWVFDAASDGSGLAGSVVDAVVGLLNDVHFNEVHAEPGTDPLGLIARVELDPVTQASGVSAPETADRLPSGAPDGVPDSYLNVTRRQLLGFAAVIDNTRLPPSDEDQHYRVSVRLMGDGVLLEERLLGLVVPAGTRQPTAADADAGP